MKLRENIQNLSMMSIPPFAAHYRASDKQWQTLDSHLLGVTCRLWPIVCIEKQQEGGEEKGGW